MPLRCIFTCGTFSSVAHLEISLFWTGYALVVVVIYGVFHLNSSLCGCYFAPLCPCWVAFSVSFELYVHGCLQASVDTIMKEKMPKKGGRWWFSWRSRNSDSKSVSRLVHRYSLSLSLLVSRQSTTFFPHRTTFDLCVCLGFRIGGRRSL